MKNNIHEILLEIESIKMLLESIGQTKDNTSSVEYGLAMDKMRKVYGMMSEVNKFKETIDIESVSELVEIKILAKLSEVIDTIIERKIKSLNIPHADQPAEVNPKPAVNKVAEPEKQPEEKVEKHPEKPKEEPPVKNTTEQKVFNETLAEKNKAGKSVYDVLSKEAPSTETTRMVGQAVPDLEKAISLNEKFVFIKELFGGNAQKYSQTITKLNSLSGIAEAMSYVSSHFPEWNLNDPAAKSFMELVKRRFL